MENEVINTNLETTLVFINKTKKEVEKFLNKNKDIKKILRFEKEKTNIDGHQNTIYKCNNYYYRYFVFSIKKELWRDNIEVFNQVSVI